MREDAPWVFPTFTAASTTISVAELRGLIGAPDAPVIVDVCIDEDFDADPRLIPTAFRWPHDRIADLAPSLGGRGAVVVCQKGLKLSQGAAALLRSAGAPAVALEGGVFAWRDAGAPYIPAAAMPARHGDGATRWVAPSGPDLATVAALWLIRRFVDRDARFLFVAPDQIAAVADRFAARALPAADPMPALLRDLALATPALDRLAAHGRERKSG